jgi:hypothetical protein
MNSSDLDPDVIRRRSGVFASTILRTPSGGTVKTIERGPGIPAVFLHSGVGAPASGARCS